MKRYRSVAGLALAVLVVLILAAPAAAQVPVPFNGRLVGVDIGTPVVPPIVSAQVKATGHATSLGKFTYTALLTVNTATGLGSGTFLFTTVNGDTVIGTISGKATFTPPNVLSIMEIATITGGTGRFTGATGSLTITRLKNTVTGVTTASFTGIISRGP
jgi:hypothetical protein